MSSGTVVRKPASKAFFRVEMDGDPRAAYRNTIRWDIVACGVVLLIAVVANAYLLV